MKNRCPWLRLTNAEYVEYHDKEWGRPVHDDRLLFEMLILEGAQAGLSWETILKKRAEYKKVFRNFEPKKVAKMTAADQKRLMQNPGIVRNRLKIESTITNAKAFLEVQKEFGSFAEYLWAFVDGRPVRNKFRKMSDYKNRSDISDRISKDLKKRGFRFVGTTIIYAYMQAVGLTNDHSVDCFCGKAVR
jgi:DNA-3-methyladenine glycosylase I